MRWLTICVLSAVSCQQTDPIATPLEVEDQPIEGMPCSPAPAYVEDLVGCSRPADDYSPNADDSWPSCISDDGTYERIEPSISSIARVEAFEGLADLLWRSEPTHADFLAARVLFEREQGLGSRVARRYDVHYEDPGVRCDDAGVAELYPDYCVGPATLQPLIVSAFAEGALGRDRLVNAARIRAALEWFLYVSTVKEATTCTDTPKDCDSSWAYYGGGTPREDPIGLAAAIDELAHRTHDYAYDGVLAVRCWRDLDQAIPAEDLDLRDRAIAQTDRAVARGVALLIRQRFAELDCATGDYREAALEGLRILVPLLDRETRARSLSVADELNAAISGDNTPADAVAALDATYPCP